MSGMSCLLAAMKQTEAFPLKSVLHSHIWVDSIFIWIFSELHSGTIYKHSLVKIDEHRLKFI